MARTNYVRRARQRHDRDNNPLPNHKCETCTNEIVPGSPYKWVKPKIGPFGGPKRIRCQDCPDWRPWDLSNSLSAQLSRVSHEFQDRLTGVDSVDDVKQALSEVADEIRGIAEDKRESAQNMEEGFGHATSQSDDLNETADNLDSWADEIESAEPPEFPEPEEQDCEHCADEEDQGCEHCTDGRMTPDEPTEEQIEEWRDLVGQELTIVDEPPF